MKKFLKKLAVIPHGIKKLHKILSTPEWIRRVLWLSTPLFVFYCFFITEYSNRGNFSAIFSFMESNVPKTIFAFVFLFLISGALILIFRYLWAYALILGLFSLIASCVNYMKMGVNGDNFLPWDITMLGNADQLLGFAKIEIPAPIIVFGILLFLYILLLAFAGPRVRLRWWSSLLVSLSIVIPVTGIYFLPRLSNNIFSTVGMSFDDTFTQGDNYSENGFINAYFLNFFSLAAPSPDDYSEENIQAILAKYAGVDSLCTPDIIVVMSEAFSDVRQIKGTEFSYDPLENFDAIASHPAAASGTLYTTAFGGGTVRTEFDFLTGLSVDSLKNGTSPWLYLKEETETYVSHYKSLGYKTTAIHTYESTFYDRNKAYPLIGFDEFLGQEYIEEHYPVTYRRHFITDHTFLDVVFDTLEKNYDVPNFIYGITMENHGGYDPLGPADTYIEVKNDAIDPDLLATLSSYTQGVYLADLSLKRLIEYVDNRGKPTIVIFFGDHKPVIGQYGGAYHQAGNINQDDGYNTEENKYIYSAPYLVYTNYYGDLGKLRTSNELSINYLLALVAESTCTGMTPYMQYLSDAFDTLPVYNARLGIELDKKQTAIVDDIRDITYDRIMGERYSVKKRKR